MSFYEVFELQKPLATGGPEFTEEEVKAIAAVSKLLMDLTAKAKCLQDQGDL